jgi:hypothetical protein
MTTIECVRCGKQVEKPGHLCPACAADLGEALLRAAARLGRFVAMAPSEPSGTRRPAETRPPKFAVWQMVETPKACVARMQDPCKYVKGLVFRVGSRGYDEAAEAWFYCPVYDGPGVPRRVYEGCLLPHTMTLDDLTEFQKSMRPGTRVRVVQRPVNAHGVLTLEGGTEGFTPIGKEDTVTRVLSFTTDSPHWAWPCALMPAFELAGGGLVWPWNVEDPCGPARNWSEPENET